LKKRRREGGGWKKNMRWVWRVQKSFQKREKKSRGSNRYQGNSRSKKKNRNLDEGTAV